MIRTVITKTLNNIAAMTESVAQSPIQCAVKTDLTRSPFSGDYFALRPSRLNKITSIPNSEYDKIVKEIKNLILTNLNGDSKSSNLSSINNQLKKILSQTEISDPNALIETFTGNIDKFKAGIIDLKIKETVINEISNYDSFGTIFYNVAKLADLADLDSSLQKRSYSLRGDNYKTIKYLLKNEQTKPILDEIAQTPVNKYPKIYDAVLLQREMELDSLKSYLALSSETEPELSKYLYEKYYLPRLSLDIKTTCQKISDEFGTKLFVENENGYNSTPNAIYEELSEWKKTATEQNDEFFAPLIIDLSKFNSHYNKNPKALGFANFHDSVHIKGDRYINIINALRHELEHVNDPVIYGSGEINGIDVDKIIVRKHTKTNAETYDVVLGKCKYKDEFFNAGISPEHIPYAYTNALEFKAVAAEGDCSKYSPEFKELLVRLGMPKYILNMEQTNYHPIENAQYISDLRQKHPELKTMDEILSYTKKHLKDPKFAIEVPIDIKLFVEFN